MSHLFLALHVLRHHRTDRPLTSRLRLGAVDGAQKLVAGTPMASACEIQSGDQSDAAFSLEHPDD